jgi:hypothetical protein
MLAELYFPQEARAVRGLLAAPQQHLTEAAASTSVLGLSFESLGVGVAQSWGLPEGMRRCMRKPGGEPPLRPPVGLEERLRWIATAANDIADTLQRADPKDLPVRLALLSRRYAKTLGLSPEAVQKATLLARKKLIEMADAMEIQLPAGSGSAQLLKTPSDDSILPIDGFLDTLAPSHPC